MQASHRVDVVAVLVRREISGRRAQHMLLRRNGCLVAPTVDYVQRKENTTAGVDSTPAVLVARPTSSSWTTEVGEIDEARAAPVQQERDAVPEATGATGPISGEGLVPIGLQHFAHRVGAGRQTREAIVPRASVVTAPETGPLSWTHQFARPGHGEASEYTWPSMLTDP